MVAPIPAPRGNTQTAATGGSARALFDQAYGALNRREYTQAETYFQQFLDQYPNDALAGSAQYWLGKSAFVSGEYKTAADRFLKTFTNYPNNERAPEALLKLAISLRQLAEQPRRLRHVQRVGAALSAGSEIGAAAGRRREETSELRLIPIAVSSGRPTSLRGRGRSDPGNTCKRLWIATAAKAASR